MPSVLMTMVAVAVVEPVCWKPDTAMSLTAGAVGEAGERSSASPRWSLLRASSSPRPEPWWRTPTARRNRWSPDPGTTGWATRWTSAVGTSGPTRSECLALPTPRRAGHWWWPGHQPPAAEPLPGVLDAVGQEDAQEHGRTGHEHPRSAGPPRPRPAVAWLPGQDGARVVRGGPRGTAGRGQQQRQQGHQRGQPAAAAFLPVGPVCGAGGRLQFRDERLGVRGPFLRILGQTAPHQLPHRLGNLLGGDGRVDVLQREFGEIVTGVRLVARQALEERGGGRIHVRRGRGGRAGPLLRGHVGGVPAAPALVPASAAIPKSTSLEDPSGTTRTFSGL